MLANKQDDPEALSVPQIQAFFNPLAEQLDAREAKVLPISALEGMGIREAMDWIAERVALNRDQRPPLEA